MRLSSWLLVSVLAAMGMGVEGIGFDLISSKVKCFSEDISGNTLVVSPL